MRLDIGRRCNSAARQQRQRLRNGVFWFQAAALSCLLLLINDINEPTHEIMALIALRKLNLETRMRSNPLGLYV